MSFFNLRVTSTSFWRPGLGECDATELPPWWEKDEDSAPVVADLMWRELAGRGANTRKQLEIFYRDREEEGRHVDPATAEVDWWWWSTSDPYWLIPDVPEEDSELDPPEDEPPIGRCFFARAPGGVWVSFEHLPAATVKALQPQANLKAALPAARVIALRSRSSRRGWDNREGSIRKTFPAQAFATDHYLHGEPFRCCADTEAWIRAMPPNELLALSRRRLAKNGPGGVSGGGGTLAKRRPTNGGGDHR
jgi:hypothetical protein